MAALLGFSGSQALRGSQGLKAAYLSYIKTKYKQTSPQDLVSLERGSKVDHSSFFYILKVDSL